MTIEEIAEAADVGRMTVFNHFRRKEDMFFDLDQVWRDDLLDALRQREPGVSSVEAFRQFAHQAVEQQKPYVDFSPESQRFNEVLEASEPLKARWRAIRDEAAEALAGALSEVAGSDYPDMEARFAAHLLTATWSAAVTQGYVVFQISQDTRAAEATFLALADKGSAGVTVAMAGTPYV